MIEIKDSVVWGIYVYEFNLKANDLVPYQLTFERDLYFNRTHVHLLNLFGVEDNSQFCIDARQTIFQCFQMFFQSNPEEVVYFELDLSHKRNFLKFLKFYRWAACFPAYKFTFEMIDIEDIKYAKVSIFKI